MTLGDAIIAATALVYGRSLATRNIGNFRWIAELTLINPFEAQAKMGDRTSGRKGRTSGRKGRSHFY
ncbi:MAG: hypothetical protein WBA89_15905 [Microcoleus sp.]|uniref:hypothetical protein n=1 Tax=Microcoleus sp. TaxID=44472 RepID=UPI003C76B8DB